MAHQSDKEAREQYAKWREKAEKMLDAEVIDLLESNWSFSGRHSEEEIIMLSEAIKRAIAALRELTYR